MLAFRPFKNETVIEDADKFDTFKRVIDALFASADVIQADVVLILRKHAFGV